ncbi:MAG TPA: hypothetical protein VH559_06670 [Gemmatimonadaceae bacterium]
MKPLQQARLRRRQFFQGALHDRALVLPLDSIGFIRDGIGVVVADSLDILVSPMIAEQPARDARQPCGRVLGKAVPVPVIDGAEPGLLRDVLRQFQIAAAPPDDEVEQVVDGCPIDGADVIL